MRMFSPEELAKIKEQYYKIYTPLVETDFFSLLYDKSEDEWCYVISEHITLSQLIKARGYFLTALWKMFGKEKTFASLKPFTVSDYLDNANNMMADDSLFKLYGKFNFMLPAFAG